MSGARWYNVRSYCYTCGLISRLPVVGGRILRRHTARIVERGE